MRISDWSSDVCSSDLGPGRDVVGTDVPVAGQSHRAWRASEVEVFDPDAADVVADGLDQVCQTRSVRREDRKSVVEGKSVSVRGDVGGRRIVKKKNVTV